MASASASVSAFAFPHPLAAPVAHLSAASLSKICHAHCHDCASACLLLTSHACFGSQAIVGRRCQQLPNRRSRLQRNPAIPMTATLVQAKQMVFLEGDKEIPPWIGESLTARVVKAVVTFPPLFSILKHFARGVMVSTAEKTGVEWRTHVEKLRKQLPLLEELKQEIENPDVVYPSYYEYKIHGYEEGNLNWQAALEAEPAAYAVFYRAFNGQFPPAEALATLGSTYVSAIENHRQSFFSGAAAAGKEGEGEGGRERQGEVSAPLPVERVVDLGCSIGISTDWLSDKFPNAHIIGVELSTYFLAMAELRQRQGAAAAAHVGKQEEEQRREVGSHGRRQVQWLHARADKTDLPSGSCDVVSLSFVAHELPAAYLLDLLREAKRLLRPGGVFALVDISPKSKTLQDLPPPIFVLMALTEPYISEYMTMDMEAALTREGFQDVRNFLASPRHRVITAVAS